MSSVFIQLRGTIAATMLAVLATVPAAKSAAETPAAEIRIGYFQHSTTSIVAQKFGWAEQEFAKSGTKVRWVEIARTGAAFDQVTAGSVDLLLSAIGDAMAARAGGVQVKAIANPLVGPRSNTEVFVASDKFVAAFPLMLERAARLKIRVDAWVQNHPLEIAELGVVKTEAVMPADATTRDPRREFRMLAENLVTQGAISRGTNIETLLDGLIHLEPALRVAAFYPNGTTR